MKLEDQVLSIEQVQELQELGFDFRKYSSACVIEAKDRNKYIVDRRLIGLHIGFMETEVIEYHETMTIGDIIDVLPEKIKTYSRNADKEIYLYPRISNRGIIYTSTMIEDCIFCSIEDKLINNLFNTLVWCIKEKHIKL
jgi:hypothetical protein